MKFEKAEKKDLKLRLSIAGPSGSGKTFSALAIGTKLGDKVAVIDTEHRSASRYADIFNFDVVELENHNLDNYIGLINEAEKAGYDVLIIDSLSHAWFGEGGELDMVEDKAKLMKTPNSYTAWRFVTPAHTKFINAITGSKMHIIATMRVKAEYVIEQVNGKSVPKKLGLGPIQKEGTEHEFDVFGEMNMEHEMSITKSRIYANGVNILQDKVFSKPGESFAKLIIDWMGSGEVKKEPEPAKVEQPIVTPTPVPTTKPDVSAALDEYITKEQAKVLWQMAKSLGFDSDSCMDFLGKKGIKSFAQIPVSEFDKMSKPEYWREVSNG